MKIYNSDGTEAKMCGNAASVSLPCCLQLNKKSVVSIETISTTITAALNNNNGEISTTIILPPQSFLIY